MIDTVANADALPVLERLMSFAGARHRLITANIANLSTPGYEAMDLSVDGFREQLSEAIDARREQHGATGGPLEPAADAAEPEALHANLLFHDRGDRDLERTMQSLVENFMTFRMAAQLMRNRFDVINTAIRERI